MIAIAAITPEPLSLDAHVDAVRSPRFGAVATFVGLVRDHDPSVAGEVTHLEYSSHPDAGSAIARLAAHLDRDDVTIAVTHRTGMLAVGDAAIVAAVGSAHRAEALTVLAELVERVKAEAPIWKREILTDGSHTWVGIQ